jgi:hypothetical protein
LECLVNSDSLNWVECQQFLLKIKSEIRGLKNSANDVPEGVSTLFFAELDNRFAAA